MNSLKRQLTLRLKNELAEKIGKRAKEMGVSVNAYVVMILTNETK